MRDNQTNSFKGEGNNGREPEPRIHTNFAESFKRSEKIDKSMIAYIFLCV